MSNKKKTFRRIFTIVIDSLGIGAADDAAFYHDAGTDTLGHIAQHVPGLMIPNLRRLGLASLHPLDGITPAESPAGYFR